MLITPHGRRFAPSTDGASRRQQTPLRGVCSAVSRLGFEDWGLGFAVLELGFEVCAQKYEPQSPDADETLGFAIWRRNLEAQTCSCLGFVFLRQKHEA